MHDNELDKIFKQKINEIDHLPGNISWDKENSWIRLQKKRRKKIFRKVYFYAAAILIVGFIIGQATDFSYFGKETKISIENPEVEYQKRLKLAEIESRMSGNYYSVKICFACDDVYYQVIKEDKPIKSRYFETNLN